MMPAVTYSRVVPGIHRVTKKRARAAVTVAWALGLFVASQAIFASVLPFLPGVRDPLYADKAEKLRSRMAANPSAQVFVQFGSSRTSNALRGLEMEPRLESLTGRSAIAFNFGVPACGPIIQSIYLSRWLKADRHPDLVLLEIHPAMLSSQVPQPMESHFADPERFTPEEARIVCSHEFPRDRFFNDAIASEFAPVFGQRFHIMGRSFKFWLPFHNRFDSSRGTDATGWMRCIYDDLPDETRQSLVDRARSEYGDFLKTLRLDGSAAQAVRESIALCREKGIPVCAILMPEGPTFRSLYTEDAENRIRCFLQSLRHEFGVEIIDACDWLEETDFMDSHHMLPRGASRFTERLASAIAPQLAAIQEQKRLHNQVSSFSLAVPNKAP